MATVDVSGLTSIVTHQRTVAAVTDSTHSHPEIMSSESWRT